MDTAVGMEDRLFESDLGGCTTGMCDVDNPSPWDNLSRIDEDDLSNFLDMESNFSADEFISQLPEDLEMPMLKDEPLLGESLLGFRLDDSQHSDSSDSGIEFPKTMKSEPMSPMSSHSSELSLDSAQSYGSCMSSLDIPMCSSSDLITYSDPMSAEPLTTVTVIKQEPTINCQLNSVPNGIVSLSAHKPLTPPLTPTTADNVQYAAQTSTLTLDSSNNVVKLLIPAQTEIKQETTGTLARGCSADVVRVLSSKAKVLPKPVPSTGASKTLVLTPEEFVKLTSQKLLNVKTNPTSPQTTINTNVIHPYKQAIPGLKSSLSCVNPQQTDVKTLKRQQRMMKNRESACLSRKRKKEYLTALEKKLEQYTTENEKLKSENENLKKAISALQSENSKLRKVLPSGVLKGSTIMLGVLLLLSLNLGPLLSIIKDPSYSNNIQHMTGRGLSQSSVHHGRTLLSYDYLTDASVDSFTDSERLEREWGLLRSVHLNREGTTDQNYAQNISLKLVKQIEALTGSYICPTYFNSTESQRLLNELRGWVRGHEEEQKRQQHHQEKKVKNKHVTRFASGHNRKYVHGDRLKHTGTHLHNMEQNVDTHQDYGVQVFTGREHQYRSFLKTLQRRNDTFYVVSFRQDHLLLPATAHNKTMRPRMSLVMPANGLNETMSPPDGSIMMMQIDCEVTATKLVHIHKSEVPENLDPNITHHNYPHMAQNAYYSDDKDDYVTEKQKRKKT